MKTALALFVSILISCTCFRSDEYDKLETFRGLRIGSDFPLFGGYSTKKNGNESFSHKEHKTAGKFVIAILNNGYSYDDWCIDAACGAIGHHIVQKMGHMLVMTDGKLARQFRVELVPGKGQLDRNVMVVGDRDWKVAGIYENAVLEDVPGILRKYHKDLIQE